MFGADAPAHVWQMTFLHAYFPSPPANFVGVPPGSPLFALGNGQTPPAKKKHHHPGGGGGGGHGGGGGGGGGPGPGGGGGGPNH
jgi:hypothetical protein